MIHNPNNYNKSSIIVSIIFSYILNHKIKLKKNRKVGSTIEQLTNNKIIFVTETLYI